VSLVALGLLGVAVLLALLFILRLPVGFAMALVGLAGFWRILDARAAMSMAGSEVWTVFSSYGLTVIPLFILMGQICFHSGVNQRLYRTAYAWLGPIRGGVAMATVLACAGFAAICGSNTATAATMSAVALPEMKKYRYHPVLSTGAVAAGSTLGVLIPPSVVLIVIGLQTGESIAKLFWGGLGPGVLLALLFLAAIHLVCRRNKGWGPRGPRTSFRSKLASLSGSVEMLVLFALVMGGLFLGLFTPTEAGAAGAGLAFLLSAATRRLTFKGLKLALADTLRVSCMIMVIILGAVIFGRFLALTRLPFEAAEWVAALDVPDTVVILVICGVYVFGGAIMDALALLLITIPIFFPVAESMGLDPIWFAALITVVTTMGAITPPVGVNTFIVASMAGEASLPQVFRGVSLFLVCFALCVAAMLAFPGIATYLPALLH
jgi:tripartite ATP-independent transporter DctM subunit